MSHGASRTGRDRPFPLRTDGSATGSTVGPPRRPRVQDHAGEARGIGRFALLVVESKQQRTVIIRPRSRFGSKVPGDYADAASTRRSTEARGALADWVSITRASASTA